jgi:hypothetical protein
MPPAPLEQRVTALEAEVAKVERKLEEHDTSTPWWEQIMGTFDNDPNNMLIEQYVGKKVTTLRKFIEKKRQSQKEKIKEQQQKQRQKKITQKRKQYRAR